jgi:hypothetical protein
VSTVPSPRPSDQAPSSTAESAHLTRSRQGAPGANGEPFPSSRESTNGPPGDPTTAQDDSVLVRSLSAVAPVDDPVIASRNSGAKIEWRETRRDHPCEICDHNSWCSYSTCGTWAACRRESQHSAFGPGKKKGDKSGGQFWLFCLRAQTRAEAWGEPRFHHAQANGQRADADS